MYHLRACVLAYFHKNIFKGVSTPLDPKCICNELEHLVALDNRSSIQVSPLLIVRLSNLNVIALAKCLDHRNENAPTTYTFALSLLFFFYFFSKSKHLIITMDNVYQMMLRYKRWTFEAWYQSECTIIPSLAPWLVLYHLETYFEKIPLVKTYLKKKLSSNFISSFNLTTSIHHTSMDILKFRTYAMQANIWNAHSNTPYKFMSLLRLLVCSKF